MIRLKSIAPILLSFILFHSTTQAGGKTGLAFLKIGAGARASALGEAFVATSDDASGLFWNPAGSAFIGQKQAHLTHTEWIQGITHEVVSLALPASIGTIGLAAALNNVDGLERREIASAEPLGTMSAHDFLFGLTYARKLNDHFAIGLAAKYLYEKIYTETASGMAVDFGFRYQAFLRDLWIGASAQNLGFMDKLMKEEIPLPKTFRFGGAWIVPSIFLRNQLLLAADFVTVVHDESYFNFGGEFRPLSQLFLRAGYQSGRDDRGLSAGLGLKVNGFMADYAYVPFASDLGTTQRISFTVDF